MIITAITDGFENWDNSLSVPLEYNVVLARKFQLFVAATMHLLFFNTYKRSSTYQDRGHQFENATHYGPR